MFPRSMGAILGSGQPASLKGCHTSLPADSARLLLCVFEFRQGLNRFLGCAGEHELVVLLFELLDRNEHIVPSEPDNDASPNDDERHGGARCNDECIDSPDPLLLLVVDGLPEQLLLRAPAERDRTALC